MVLSGTHPDLQFAFHQLAQAPPGKHHKAKHGQCGPGKGAVGPS